jgi:H(+)-translocating pyrophosphatase
MSVLKQGCAVAVVLAAGTFIGATRWLLYIERAPEAWWHFACCGLIGMFTGYLLVLITEYYTDFRHPPVRAIALASESGHGTNVIAGLGVGMESTTAPVLLVSTAILSAYYLGRTSGVVAPDGVGGFDDTARTAAGLFGTAVATMGMLSNLTYVLAMDVFGPITDNAAGIVEMSPDCPAGARDTMDRLDAAGNTTKAFTKGFAVGSAGLACFLLFRAFLDIAEGETKEPINIDIVQPEVFVAGLVGAMTVFLFSSFAMQAVGSAAQEVVHEVRRQFRDLPGIADGSTRPEYGACVGIVSRSAIRMMVKPGLLVVIMPTLVGIGFRIIGGVKGDAMLGGKCMCAYLVCSSMSAMLLALTLNNGGGAWDNAKKYIESGQHGGKGSEAHKAAVTGDTVGDPCKDTAGPSLHVLMKLTATVTMVVGPLVALPRN